MELISKVKYSVILTKNTQASKKTPLLETFYRVCKEEKRSQADAK